MRWRKRLWRSSCAALTLAVLGVAAPAVLPGPGTGPPAAASMSPHPAAAVALARTPDGAGYWVAISDGGVFSFGDAHFYGSAGSIHLNAPIVAMAATPDGAGYWLVASDGGVFSFGDAHFYGSAGSIHLNAPVVGLASTPDGAGYWLVASAGGVFSFGDAHFYGSAGSIHLNAPIVAVDAAPDGAGYWLVASDGGVFSFGDAHFYGSAGSIHLNAPIVAMAATPDGAGYWLVASDGGVFSFGDAHFYGSAGSIHLNAPIVAMAATPDGAGYWLVASDGGVFNFGHAHFYGSATDDINPLLVDQLASTGGAQQVIVVDAPDAASTTATLYTFEKDGNGWYQAFAPMPARNGENGWSPGPERREGDGTSPEGIFPVGSTMYGTDADPGTRFPYHRLVCGDWWDEDASSPTYNTFQHVACGTNPPFGGDSEALWTEGNAYPSMAVIDFNTPPDGPLGSGMFLHADLGSPTRGCISLPYTDLVAVLRWLNPALQPAVVMGPDSVVRTF